MSIMSFFDKKMLRHWTVIDDVTCLIMSDTSSLVCHNMGIVHSSHVTFYRDGRTNNCNIFSRFYHTLSIFCNSLYLMSNAAGSTLCPGD